jgi:ATP-binding cassette subfamily B multidrug efflux pump
MGLGAVVVLWVGSQRVISGRITVGELVALNGYLMMLAWPMIAFGWVTSLIQRGLASWKRLVEIFDAVPAIDDSRATNEMTDVSQIRGQIEFRNLTFAYGGAPVLRNVTAIIPAGTTTAIIGATGSGKSTLLGLLPRLYDAPEGAVFVDGVDVRHIPLQVLRGGIGFVPQEPFLFGATIAENIAFGLPGNHLREGSVGQDAEHRDVVERYAAIARLDKDLPAFPHGYDTVVGERGITLSGGQKQRTALARALALDAPILLLDDALSAVDTYTEEEILGRLSGVMRDRTTILVSHRISTVRGADQILVLDEGQIVERGTHDELVRANGAYAELHRTQLLEDELAAS